MECYENEGYDEMERPQVYIGKPEALKAEIGLLDCYTGPYVVACFAEDGTAYEPDYGIKSKKEAKSVLEWLGY